MSWTLSASGRLDAGAAHLEQELHDALQKVLSEPRFGLLVSHFQGPTADCLHTVAPTPPGQPEGSVPAEPAPEPEPAAAADKPAKATAKSG